MLLSTIFLNFFYFFVLYLIKTDTKFAVIYKENAIKNVRI